GDERSLDLAALLAAAYPAMAPLLVAHAEDVRAIANVAKSMRRRDARAYRALLPAIDDPRFRAKLRRFSFREKIRVAARELSIGADDDVEVTARELSDLADACIDAAVREALGWAEARFGLPTDNSITVLGMGKLGGRELNAGSDVDLIFAYDNDESHAREVSAHELYTRVAQRATATLDEATEDGIVWRVDLRLRPEGGRGPLVNSHAALERYYESWGRTWERAALVRARPCGGDLALGNRILETLAPFVWRREVNPAIAGEMATLVARARAEIGGDPELDLKHGRGGIREAEFFVQSLELIWGGRETSVRQRNTIDALTRLRARGLVTDREAREVADAYLALRRVEHRIQFATLQQTHSLPTDPELGGVIARSLGFVGFSEMKRDLDKHRRRVEKRFASLAPNAAAGSSPAKLFVALEAEDEAQVKSVLEERAPLPSPDFPRHLLALARRPDDPLGASSRDHFPDLAPALVDTLLDAADPDQAAQLLASFFARLITPTVYVRALAHDLRALRRLVGLFGASRFLGSSLVAHPELADSILFTHGTPTEETAARAVAEEVAACERGDVDSFVGALRRAKRRVTMEVGVCDLAGEIDFRMVSKILSALADAEIQAALDWALVERKKEPPKMAVLALGKLGGRELGYGSDLDIVFLHEEDDDEKRETAVRVAQRVLRLLDAPHGEGAGYELDTRLRPSGSQGLLVVSIDAFARYQAERAEAWERQALIKARPCAGDEELGRKASIVAETAAYERGAPTAERIHELRMRMQRELSAERTAKGRYDMKLGAGGLADIELAIQWLQMKLGLTQSVRSGETEEAISRLELAGGLDAHRATILRDAYVLFRRLEQRARVHTGSAAGLLTRDGAGIGVLARRLGMRDGPRGSASAALLNHYVATASEVRRAYLSILDLAPTPDDLGPG
ncbi:MAG: bifunctional [glutamate--ammonia ligase]-adenylyl-L-tyrosine phosphorylase/[glutamate--ammonia-ligase] adenylyltransferase, partial [Polyangiaceae bacterium]